MLRFRVIYTALPTCLLMCLLGAAPKAFAIEIIHLTAAVSATADGLTESASLMPNSPGTLSVEMGTLGGTGDYGKATLSSLFASTYIDLATLTTTDHIDQFGSANASVSIDFVVTSPTTYALTPFAQSAGSGWLGYGSNFVLTDSEGWVWEYNSEDGYYCHPVRWELCPPFNPVLAVGEYTLSLVGGPAYYPPDCETCTGYASYNSTSARFDFAAAPTPTQQLQVDLNELSWNATPDDAQYYDVVRGDLQTLRATLGDFSASEVDCLSDDDPNAFLPYPLAPFPGEGWWFLVRKAGDTWGGSWDSTSGSQQGSRNRELSQAPASCP